ncbi:hypothetical protein HK405_014664 [Cladochytrium tenue]|nr:hypothetical protein HK405_014664 [Cladochytrium tenue]
MEVDLAWCIMCGCATAPAAPTALYCSAACMAKDRPTLLLPPASDFAEVEESPPTYVARTEATATVSATTTPVPTGIGASASPTVSSCASTAGGTPIASPLPSPILAPAMGRSRCCGESNSAPACLVAAAIGFGGDDGAFLAGTGKCGRNKLTSRSAAVALAAAAGPGTGLGLLTPGLAGWLDSTLNGTAVCRGGSPTSSPVAPPAATRALDAEKAATARLLRECHRALAFARRPRRLPPASQLSRGGTRPVGSPLFLADGDAQRLPAAA